MPEYIDMTPTWAEAAQMYIALLESGTCDGKHYARTEILRMGAIIDQMKLAAATAMTPTVQAVPATIRDVCTKL